MEVGNLLRGDVYGVKGANIVSFVIQKIEPCDTQHINSCNKALQHAYTRPKIQVLLPFYYNGDIINNQWTVASRVNGTPYALLVRERPHWFEATKDKPHLPFTDKQIVLAMSLIVEELRANNFFLVDCKLDTFAMRIENGHASVVLADISSLRQYDALNDQQKLVYYTQYYKIFTSIPKQVALPKEEEAFTNTCNYALALTFLCTVIDWHAEVHPFMRCLLETVKPRNETKHHYIAKFLKNPFDNELAMSSMLYEAAELTDTFNNVNVSSKRDAILTVTDAAEKLENVYTSIEVLKNHSVHFKVLYNYITSPLCTPFDKRKKSVEKEPMYGEFYELRASFVDKCQ